MIRPRINPGWYSTDDTRTTAGTSAGTTVGATVGTLSPSGLAALALFAAATWALARPYQGIFHDARLYTLQALAHLHPGALSGDVFLRFGSQDRYTLFSAVYATMAHWLGIEPAAALLTLVSQGCLLLGAWALTRAVMPFSAALLGLCVLVAIPGWYGADRVFTCIEPFVTPRMAAEALVLAALAAALGGRKTMAITLTFIAAMLHPIMAMAGVCALYWLYVGERRPVLAAALAIVGVKALALVAFVMPVGQWGRFDSKWLVLVQERSPFLFVLNWSLDDWALVAVSGATLLAGARTLVNPSARTLSRIALITSVGGLTLTLIGCDWLHLVLFTQLQPWRWQWLGTAVAAVLLPEILRTLWGADRAGRTAGILLLAAWVFASNAYALVAAVAALTSLAALRRLKPSESRWVFFGAIGMLSIAVVWRVASNLEFTDAHYIDPAIPLWLRRTMSFTLDGSIPMALMALIWWLAQRPSGRLAVLLAGAMAAAACVVLAPKTWHSWTARDYTARQFAEFARMRRFIPPGSEVFWPQSPVAAWLLLDRPSYLSIVQTSGLVFSRPGALELERRANALRGAVSQAAFMKWDSGLAAGTALSAQQLSIACGTGEFDFLVTSADLGMEPVAVNPTPSGQSLNVFRLYRCRATKGTAAIRPGAPGAG